MRVGVGIAIIVIASSTLMARGQSLQEQDICAKQAESTVAQLLGQGGNDGGRYQSHYNTKLKKCLLLFDLSNLSAILIDASERRPFAYYLGLPPVTCELTPPFQEKTSCSSKEEFDAFVAKYMEE